MIHSEDPTVATYVYLILDYLGQERVKLLDGGIEGWTAARKPTRGTPEVKPKTIYIPEPRSDLIASYNYVKRKDVRVLDARPSREYAVGAIQGSTNIPYDSVLTMEKFKERLHSRICLQGLAEINRW